MNQMESTFNLNAERIRAEESDEDCLVMFNRLTQFQATNFMTVIRKNEPCTATTFCDCYFKSLNSVILYKHKILVENRLLRIFKQCDKNGNGLVRLNDLPLKEVLLGDDDSVGRSTKKTEVVVYNDSAVEATSHFSNAATYTGAYASASGNTRIVGGSSLAHRGGPGDANNDNNKHNRPGGGGGSVGGRVGAGKVAPTKNGDIDLSQCSDIRFHVALKKYTMSYEHDLILFDIVGSDNSYTFEVHHVILGHSAPVLRTLHVPHVKQMFTTSADRSVRSWSEEDRWSPSETVRVQSTQICMTYDTIQQYLITGGTDGCVLLFPVVPRLSQAVKRIAAYKKGSGEWIMEVSVLPDIDVLSTCSSGSTVKFWDRFSLNLKSSKCADTVSAPGGASAQQQQQNAHSSNSSFPANINSKKHIRASSVNKSNRKRVSVIGVTATSEEQDEQGDEQGGGGGEDDHLVVSPQSLVVPPQQQQQGSSASSSSSSSQTSMTRMTYSRGYRALYTGTAGRKVLMWSPFLDSPTEELQVHEKPLVGIHCFSSSPELITADMGGKICIVDMRKTSVVQVLGSPESISPIGSINSFTFNPYSTSIIALGERMSIFFPQKGSYSALIDITVTALSFCTISKRVCVATGNRLLVFDLTSGDLQSSHSFSGVEISCVALCSPTVDVLIGTHEGQVVATQIGSWHTTKMLHVHDSVRMLLNLGKRSRVASAKEEHPRGLVLTANGVLVHFAYGHMSDMFGDPDVTFDTGFEAVSCASFSPKSALLFLSRKNTFVVWDAISYYQKTVQETSSWITAIQCVDEVDSTFIGTSRGDIICYNTVSFVPIFEICLGSGVMASSPNVFTTAPPPLTQSSYVSTEAFSPSQLMFDNMLWSITAVGSSQAVSVQLDELIAKSRIHQRNYSAVFKTQKTLRKSYIVDTILETSGVFPAILPTKIVSHSNRKMGSEILSNSRPSSSSRGQQQQRQQPPLGWLVISISADVPACMERLDRFADFQRRSNNTRAKKRRSRSASSTGANAETNDAMDSVTNQNLTMEEIVKVPSMFIGTLIDYFVPTPVEKCMEHGNNAVYCVFEYFHSVAAVEYFADLIDTPKVSRKSIAVELKWLLFCVCSGLQALHEQHLVALFNHRSIRRAMPFYCLFPEGGLFEEGAEAPYHLPAALTPPEGTKGGVAPSNDMWLLGLFLYSILCRCPLFEMGASVSYMETVFSKQDASHLSALEGLEELAGEGLPDPLFVELVKGLLSPNPNHRLTAASVIQKVQFERPPRHLTCIPVPTIGVRDALLKIPRDEVPISTTLRPTLPGGQITCAAVCEIPTLYILAEFNGNSSHLVISNGQGQLIGVTPPNNAVSVLYSVAHEEVSSLRFASEDMSTSTTAMESRSRSGRGENKRRIRGGEETEGKQNTSSSVTSGHKTSMSTGAIPPEPSSSYNPSKYCPFFSEMKEARRTGEDAKLDLPTAYYLEGWHRLKACEKQQDLQMLRKKVASHVTQSLQAARDAENAKKDVYLMDKVNPNLLQYDQNGRQLSEEESKAYEKDKQEMVRVERDRRQMKKIVAGDMDPFLFGRQMLDAPLFDLATALDVQDENAKRHRRAKNLLTNRHPVLGQQQKAISMKKAGDSNDQLPPPRPATTTPGIQRSEKKMVGGGTTRANSNTTFPKTALVAPKPLAVRRGTTGSRLPPTRPSSTVPSSTSSSTLTGRLAPLNKDV